MHSKQVGVTGGIGAGKSTVCRVFQLLGIPIYPADTRAKWLMENEPKLVAAIKNEFGEQSYLDHGKLNREYLAEKAFSDTNQVSRLNQLVHPRVAQHYRAWVAQYPDAPYTIKEAALLFESGSHLELDKVIAVTAPVDLRVERVLARDRQRSAEQVLAIIEQQLSEEERQSKADYILFNDEKQLIIPQVLKLHQEFSA